MESSVFKDIIESLMDIPNPSREDVNRVKVKIAEKYRLNYVPSNSEIIRRLSASQRAKLLKVLRRKNVRVASGVTVIAAMTKPW
ncbi:tRNA uridine(34) 5-carboxymethylaminomethyl modification radical SAM/GNAT enzyme Elp3, partial [Candidatus Bathyarchaeota archaeon]|nr:tRNA uridine(34) 5-carboxymethylaminomethyl modification radical SAM/GNAT enzyme Elp3 [Candidatus Bathyarchaeota archaeon]